jgi:ECF transporter S component (folate family)
MDKKQHTRRASLTFRLSLSAAFLAMALVSKFFFMFSVPILGANGMQISPAGIFTAFPALLFGPLYGGTVSALSDLIGCLIKPQGAYIPWLTVTAFAGGFIKGLMFRFILNPKNYKTISCVLLAFFLFVGGFGVATHISLSNDDILPSFIANKETLPLRDQIQDPENDYSPLSTFAVNMARYNNDTYTLTKVDSHSSVISIPQKLQFENTSVTVKKIGKNALANCPSGAMILIPKSLSISEDILNGRTDVTICSPAGSSAQKYAQDRGIPYADVPVTNEKLAISPQTLSDGTFTFSSSNNYRKYLAGYINMLTIGMELVGFLLAIPIAVFWILRKKSGVQKATGSYLQFFTCIIISGLFVTIVNTEILKIFTAAYSERVFWILLIPRIAEEIIVCSIQAYFITILYSIYRKKIKPRSTYLKELKF